MTSSNEWVSTSTPYLKPGSGDAWAQEAASHSGKGTQKLTHVGEVAAPTPVAEAFDIPAGTQVVTRRRVIYLDNAPVELADTYYPMSIAQGTPLAEPRKIKGGALTLLAERGCTTARVVEDVAARMPTGPERAALQLPEGDPVLTLRRLSFDGSDRLFQVDLMVTPARLRRLRYELKVS